MYFGTSLQALFKEERRGGGRGQRQPPLFTDTGALLSLPHSSMSVSARLGVIARRTSTNFILSNFCSRQGMWPPKFLPLLLPLLPLARDTCLFFVKNRTTGRRHICMHRQLLLYFLFLFLRRLDFVFCFVFCFFSGFVFLPVQTRAHTHTHEHSTT